jgi:hypothetical protein
MLNIEQETYLESMTLSFRFYPIQNNRIVLRCALEHTIRAAHRNDTLKDETLYFERYTVKVLSYYMNRGVVA